MKAQNIEKYQNAINLLNRYARNDASIDMYSSFKRWLESYKDDAEGRTLTRLRELIQETADHIAELKADNKSILKLISMLEDQTAKQVILCRLTTGEGWQAIAFKFNYCEQSIYRYFEKGLQNLGEIVKNS